MRIAGTDLYLGGDLTEALGLEGDWLHIDLAQTDPKVEDFGDLASGTNDASLLVYHLLGAQGEVREDGPETVDGVSTTGYSLSVDLEAATDRAPEGMGALLQRNLEEWRAAGLGTTLEAHVWIDDDGLIRRAEYTSEIPPAAGGGTMTLTVGFADFGEPVPAENPPPGTVVSVDEASRVSP